MKISSAAYLMGFRFFLNCSAAKSQIDLSVSLNRVIFFVFFSLASLLICSTSSATPNYTPDKKADLATALSARLQKFSVDYPVGISVIDGDSGEVLVDLNSEQPLKPASVMKVITSAVALEELGPEFKFRTQFFQDGKTLRVVGGGDPSFVTETAITVARQVVGRGMGEIDQIFLDRGNFVDERRRVGGRAYEAGSSALSVNFNSQAFLVCPVDGKKVANVVLDPPNSRVKLSGSVKQVSGDEVQVKITPQVGSEGYEISGSIGRKADCQTIYRSVEDPASLFGEVLLSSLRVVGATVKRGFVVATGISSSKGSELLFEHRSRPLRQILWDLNQFSNNFIAEQLVYALGCDDESLCSRERGLAKLSDFVSGLRLPSGDVRLSEDERRISDGSGLSHDNRISARAITAVLLRTLNNPIYGVEFEASLSVGGRSGTLRERGFTDGAVVRAKTGTLDGVVGLAGSFQTEKASNGDEGKTGHGRIIFAILQNGVKEVESAHLLEKRLVQDLIERLRR